VSEYLGPEGKTLLFMYEEILKKGDFYSSELVISSGAQKRFGQGVNAAQSLICLRSSGLVKSPFNQKHHYKLTDLGKKHASEIKRFADNPTFNTPKK